MSIISSMTDTPATVHGLDPRRYDQAFRAQQAVVLQDAAKKFEATFVAEMLKHSGMGKERSAFGGGPGEAAFSNFLTQEYAQKISETGTIGLADHVFRALVERAGNSGLGET